MNKIKDLLLRLVSYQSRFTPKADKLGHFYWGFWYAILGVLLYLIFSKIYLVLVVNLLLASGKEVMDLIFDEGTPELRDFIYGSLPSIIIYLLLCVV